MLKVKEIFDSIQGEGILAGNYCIFVRFSGCNLKCSFCDTDHEYGEEMSAEEICKSIEKIIISKGVVLSDFHIVFTGGEPTIQSKPHLITLIDRLRDYWIGDYKITFFISLETNGTCEDMELLKKFDFVTVSPKQDFPEKLPYGDELKLIYKGSNQGLDKKEIFDQYKYCSLQPESNNPLFVRKAFDYIMVNPLWRLSLQLHKIIFVR